MTETNAKDGLDWLSQVFSFSKLSTFARCPRLFFYKYVLRRREPTSAALLFGRGVHGGMETDNLAKLRGEKLSLAAVLEAAVEEFRGEANDNDIKVDVDVFAKEHERQLAIFDETGQRAAIRPLPGSVEAGFQVALQVFDGPRRPAADVLVEGYTDVVSESRDGKVVVDFKTAGRPASAKEVENNLQLALQAIGAEAGAGGIVSFVKEGKQRATTKTRTAVIDDAARNRVLLWIGGTITSIRAALRSGDFPQCAPQDGKCQGCEFRRFCWPAAPTQEQVRLISLSPVGTMAPQEWRESRAAKAAREGK